MRLGTRVRANARVCVRPLRASRPRLPRRPSGRVHRCVCRASTSPGHPSLASRPKAPRPWGLQVLWPQAQASLPDPAFSVFPGLPNSPLFLPPTPPTRGAPGRGLRAAPPGPTGKGVRAAGRAPPLLCRPRPGAPLGFSMTASGRGAAFVPAVLASWPASPMRAGVFPGLNQSMAEARSASRSGGAPAQAPTPRDPQREAEPSPDVMLRPSCPQSQGLRPLSATVSICAQS